MAQVAALVHERAVCRTPPKAHGADSPPSTLASRRAMTTDTSRWLPSTGEAAAQDGYHVGALVALRGLRRGARLIPGTENLSGSALQTPTTVDFNSTLAQLVEYHEEQKRWLLVTMQGVLLMASSKNFGLAVRSELGEIDVVMGPASEPRHIASRMAQVLLDKGYANCSVVLRSEDRQEVLDVAKQLENKGHFTRLAKGFEDGYLGKGGRGKTIMLDLQAADTPLAARESQALALIDGNIAVLSSMLSGYAVEHMGFLIHSRTPLLLQRGMAGPEDEAKYPLKAATQQEANNFLGIMQRRRICVLHFMGPSPGTVKLVPLMPGSDEQENEEEDEEEDEDAVEKPDEVRLTAKPGQMLVFLCNQYEFSYTAAGDSVVLQAWFLDNPPDFVIAGPVSGNLEAIASVAPGPPLPRGGEQTVSLVGHGYRNPGCSDSAEKYWQCCRNGGADGMLQIPITRYDLEYYAEWRLDRQAALNMGKMYCRHQGHLEGIELFDGSFFNISKAESGGMDPEQRLTLETGWCALYDAGYDRRKTQQAGAHIGVFVGISGSDWHWVPLPPDVNAGMGATEAVIAGRVTFALNIKGPAQIINTACSASLVSMHSGKLHLLFPHDRMEAVLTTGISINTTPHVFMGNCYTNALSFGGRSFSFDKAADGFGRSEGTSASLFKLLPWNHEEVYGILAGSQSNHDGRSASLTAPNGPAQERCIRSVLAETKLEPPEIDCFECHGTGTSLGDPIEVGAFKRLYNRKPRNNPVLATTSKTNLGHTEGGAGIAGFLKCILMCMHCECCPNIHTRELNPHLDNEGFPCYFVSEAEIMTGDTCYSGVSSFGVSGTNGHCLGYSRNYMTSRGTRQQDYNRTMVGKIKDTIPNILLDNRDWKNWVNLGKPHFERPGQEYEVEALRDGSVTWRPLERRGLRKPEGPFFIRGSFNSFTMDQMTVDSSVIGLHTFEIEMGDTGQETFQIVYNLDENMIFYPAEQNCRRKTVPIMGPDTPGSNADAWLIKGSPGAYYKVEFFVFEQGARQTITWMAVKD
uniref:Type I polyketide synthase n=1 Tax=Gambierdiscus excentricus TaxID=986170 RepID=A0A1S6K809_9DINO|nr:type I polyketide synthase [Gambierdiscus excentricus]